MSRSSSCAVIYLPALWFVLWLGAYTQLVGQDVQQTYRTFRQRLQENPLILHGGLQAQMQFNSISGAPARRDPFNYFLSGQLNLDILGLQAPLSLALADGNATYRLPAYALVGLSPSYKWATVHLFRRNMQFSDYTLSDHGFNGVGLELSPGRWRFMGMYGQLRKARLEDYGYRQELDPNYARRGYALRMGYDHQGDAVYATLFKAADDPASLTVHDSLGLRAQENVVVSLEGKKKLSRFLSLDAEYAYSILSPVHPWPSREPIRSERWLSPFMTLNATSQSASAYNFGVEFSPVKSWAISVKYERVNPNFLSLGTLQYRNDFEHVAVGYRGLVAKKVSLSGRLGVERNNLDQLEVESRNRLLFAAQANIPVTTRWQAALSYNNFRQTTRLQATTDPLNPVDSIFLGSINHQWGLNSSYQINPSQRLLFMASLQNANSIVHEQITSGTSIVSNYALSYLLAPKGAPFSSTVTLLHNTITQAGLKTAIWSPVLALNYKLRDALTATFTIANNLVRQDQRPAGNILRLIAGANYALTKTQKINLQVQWLHRSKAVTNNFSEMHGQVGYGWSF